MASAPDPITSPPPVPGQPYDATSHAAAGKWACVESGPADSSGHASADFEGGPGPWKQT